MKYYQKIPMVLALDFIFKYKKSQKCNTCVIF